MSALAPTAGPAPANPGLVAGLRRAARRNTWTVGLWALLVGLLLFTRILRSNYGASEIESLAIAALPVALAAVAQAIAVISGGIDLSVGSMMAFTSVTAASLMAGGSEEAAVGIVLGVLVMGAVIGVINGTLIVVTRVPDIVVTLAMSFVWAGAALLVLNTPGGGSARWLRDLIDGTVVIEWLPRALFVLIVVVGVVWVPLRGSKLGLSLYAVGSDRLAAFRSGVNVGRTKVVAYALTGLFSAAGGLAVTASTGIGSPIPGPYTLESVAAIVLGGVSLVGGRGGLVGPIIAVFILALVRSDLTFMGIDPNVTTVIRGGILVGVVMFGGLVAIRKRRA
jgi:ribose transport system permease protein